MVKPALVVMAAGIGSRYGGLKQLEPIGPHGEIILDYSVYDALHAGFEKVIFIIKEDFAEDFREKIGKKAEKLCETHYVFQRLEDIPPGFIVPEERKKPWGTAQAILSAKAVIDSPFAVINADDFYGRSSYQILFNYLKNFPNREENLDFCLIGYILENTLSEHGTVARGICKVSNDGYLEEIHERLKIKKFGETVKFTENDAEWVEIPRESIVSMNMWGFAPHLFPELESRFPLFLQRERFRLKDAEYLIPNVVGELVQERKARVKVLPTPENWFGITYPQDVPEVKKAIITLIERGLYSENLWTGNK